MPAALTNPYRICRAEFPAEDVDVIAFEFLRRNPLYWKFFASVARRDPMEWPLEIVGPFYDRKAKIDAVQLRNL